MVVRLNGVCGALMLLMGAIGVATAQPAFFPEASDALPASEGKTYLDLLQLAVPGIAVKGTTYFVGQPIEIRHIEGWDEVETAPTGHLWLAAVPVRSDGMDRMALLANFGETEFSIGFAILALFDIEGEPRLLDAANIASDRWTSFMDPVRLSVGVDDDLLVTRSTHHNSSQAYATTTLILVRSDRLELVDTISLLSDRGCAFERSQNLTIGQGTEEPLADIVATVTELTTHTAEDCNDATSPRPGSRTITATYHWDTAMQRYTPDSDALTLLARENEERF